jgi:transposase
VVIDETSTHLDMGSRYARTERGQRAYARQLRKRGKNMTLLAGLNLEGILAPMLIEGGVTSQVFETYLRKVLLPTLQPGDIVILDNLLAHKSPGVRGLLLAKGCRLLFLPAYSPDFSPIENAFAKIKQFLRAVRALTVPDLLAALDTITPY